MKSLWLDRGLIIGPYLALVQCEKDYVRAMKDCGIPEDQIDPWIATSQANATMHSLGNQKNKLCCIVALYSAANCSPIEIAGLLVHEAVHVWQKFREDIGEKHPSSEFEAYSIQVISQQLMQAYADGIKP